MTVLAAAAVAFAAVTGTAAARTTLADTATGLAVTGDASPDAVEVWSEDSVVIASENYPVPATCAAYSVAWSGCDLSGTSNQTLDIDLGDGDDALELTSLRGRTR